MRCVLIAGAFLVGIAAAATAQTLPPTDPAALKTTAPERADASRQHLATVLGKSVDTLSPEETAKADSEVQSYLMEHPSVLPLALASKRSTTGDGRGRILEFWRRNDSVTVADQVQFLYGFGAQKRKGLSADLFSLLFPGGVRVALGTTVTSSSDGDSSDTPEGAVQRIRDGGDMYLTAAYPLLAKSTSAFNATVFAVPRVNFMFNGFGGTDTVTEATEPTVNLGAEGYLEFKDLEGLGKAFVFWRSGWQMVSEDFKTATHLDGRSFGVHQVAVGLLFNDMLRISAQRFSAPPAAAGLDAKQLTGWHLVLQLAPQRKQ